ncbi:membrane lipoprotein lipid attachment site-containing protein [Erysipelatoclostridium ramosum]|uniref:membrane lipoprotein lipid attachment site-containing protein n=1 Tax=Thomasclavelia ramosa TaxID=1547 RepID=UPI0018ABEA3E|nr:membrane lipoprotein lipid attachment site-containing protein [Thomasclavelia ramosa]MDB7093775.1 membrane lipoprotein lipid attachment site-containing protein [Thomasclavelia ramosa]
MKKILLSILAVLVLAGCSSTSSSKSNSDSKDTLKNTENYTKNIITDNNFEEFAPNEQNELPLNDSNKITLLSDGDELKIATEVTKVDIYNPMSGGVFSSKDEAFENEKAQFKNEQNKFKKYKSIKIEYKQYDDYYIITRTVDMDLLKEEAGKKAKDILNDIAFISAYAIDDEMNEEKAYDESNQTINVSKMIKNMKAELYESNYTFTVE